MVEFECHPNGNIKIIEVRNKNGFLHNEYGPAYQEWYKNEQEKSRSYWINGKFYNDNGPAIQEWYPDGQERGRSYFLNGLPHNDNGPAVQVWHPNGQEKTKVYYLDGKKLTEEEFKSLKDTVEVKANVKPVRISGESAKELEVI